MQAILIESRKGVIGNLKSGLPALVLVFTSGVWFIMRITKTVDWGDPWILLFVVICSLVIFNLLPKFTWALYFDPQNKTLFSELVPVKFGSQSSRKETIGKVLGMTVFKNANAIDGAHQGWQIDFLVDGKAGQTYYEFPCKSEEHAREIADQIASASDLKPHFQN